MSADVSKLVAQEDVWQHHVDEASPSDDLLAPRSYWCACVRACVGGVDKGEWVGGCERESVGSCILCTGVGVWVSMWVGGWVGERAWKYCVYAYIGVGTPIL